MTLHQWITSGHGTVRQIASAAGVHYATAWKWANGKKLPDWKHVPAIERATGGAVRAADFVPQPSEATSEQSEAACAVHRDGGQGTPTASPAVALNSGAAR